MKYIIGFLKTFPSRLPFPSPLQAPSFYGVYVPEPDFSLTPLTHLYARATSCCTCPFPPPPFSLFHSSYGLFKQELSLSGHYGFGCPGCFEYGAGSWGSACDGAGSSLPPHTPGKHGCVNNSMLGAEVGESTTKTRSTANLEAAWGHWWGGAWCDTPPLLQSWRRETGGTVILC